MGNGTSQAADPLVRDLGGRTHLPPAKQKPVEEDARGEPAAPVLRLPVAPMPTIPTTSGEWVAQHEKNVRQRNAEKGYLYRTDPQRFKKQHPVEYYTRKLHDTAIQAITDPVMRDVPDYEKAKVGPIIKSVAEIGASLYGLPPGSRDEPAMYGGSSFMGPPELEGFEDLGAITRRSAAPEAPAMRNETGAVPKKGAAGYAPPANRPFAESKAGRLPEFKQEEGIQIPAIEKRSNKNAPLTNRLIKIYGTTNDHLNAGFIAPDGKMIPYDVEHDAMLDRAGASPEMDTGRFVEQEGAVRTLYRRSRRGKEIIFTIPTEGVTPDQLDHMKIATEKMGEEGSVVMETTDPYRGQEVVGPVKPDDLDRMVNTLVARKPIELRPLEARHPVIPLSMRGMHSEEQTWVHEGAHAVVAEKTGLPAQAIYSHLHPENRNARALGSTHLDFAALPGARLNANNQWVLPLETVRDIFSNQLAPTLMAGGVAEEETYGLPIWMNDGMGSDNAVFYDLTKKLGYSAAEAAVLREAAIEKAKSILTDGNTLDIIRKHMSSRPDGLSEHYLMDQSGIERMMSEVNGETIYDRTSEGSLAERPRAEGGIAGPSGNRPAVVSSPAPGGTGKTASTLAGAGEGPARQELKFEKSVSAAPPKTEEWTPTALRMMDEASAGAIDPRTGKADAYVKGKTEAGVEVYPEARKSRQLLNHKPTAKDLQNFYDAHWEAFEKHPELRIGWDKTEAGWELNVGAAGTEEGANS